MTVRSGNGWIASPDPAKIGVVPLAYGKTTFPAGCRKGDVYWIFRWYLRRYHAQVEPLVPKTCWGYSYKPNANNPSVVSNHGSGTALDINAPQHPNGKKGTFTAAQRVTLKRLQDAALGALRLGEFYTSTTDGMHVEIDCTPAQLAVIVKRMKIHYPNG